MKKLLSSAFLLLPVVALCVAVPAQAQQTTPKRAASTPAPAASGARDLSMPTEAKPGTPARAKAPGATEAAAPAKPRPTNWEVYPAEHMPAGKSVTDAEAAKMESGDYSGKPLYLVGTFYVGASHKDRAILWPGEKAGPVRIVASFPLSIPTPPEGTKIVREAPRGYRITRIKRTVDEEIVIYVRDITLP